MNVPSPVRAAGCWLVVASFAVAGWYGYHRLILRSCAPDWRLPGAKTLCSPGFSERAFSQVQLGMTRAQVVALLGRPLRILEDSHGRTKKLVDYQQEKEQISFPDLVPDDPSPVTRVIYYYTLQGDPRADWFLRAVVFDFSGVVAAVDKKKVFD